MQVYQHWQDVTRNWRGCKLDEAALPTNPPPPTTLHAKVQAMSKKALALTTFFFKFLLHFILCVWTQCSSQVEVGRQSAKLILSYYVDPGDWTQGLKPGSKLFFYLTLSHLDGPQLCIFESCPELLIHSLEKEPQEQKTVPQDEHFHDLEFVLPRVQKLEPLERSTRMFGRRLFTRASA